MRFLKRNSFLHKQLGSAKTGEEYSLSAVLSTELDSQHFFIHHEILSAGKRSSSPHFHKQTEEFVYVLKGHVIAVEGNEIMELVVGDCAIFASNSEKLHFLENRNGEDAEILVVSKKLTQPDVKFQVSNDQDL